MRAEIRYNSQLNFCSYEVNISQSKTLKNPLIFDSLITSGDLFNSNGGAFQRSQRGKTTWHVGGELQCQSEGSYLQNTCRCAEGRARERKKERE